MCSIYKAIISFARTYDMNVTGQYNSVYIFISCISIFHFILIISLSRRCVEWFLFPFQTK